MSNRAYEFQPCLVSPDCLECPLAQCKYDDQAGYQAWLQVQLGVVATKETAVAMKQEGKKVRQISEELGVSNRTVLRWLADLV